MSVNKDNQTYKKTSFLTGVNSDFIQEYYALYLENPKLLTKDWIEFFSCLNENDKIFNRISKDQVGTLKK